MLQQLKPLLKDSAIYAMGNVSGKLVGLILLPYYAEKLTVAEYGILGTMEVTFQLIVALAGLNLYIAFTRWFFEKEVENKLKSVFFTTLTTVVFLAIVAIIGLYPVAPAVSRLLFNDSLQYVALFRLMTISAGLEIIGQIPATLCKMKRKPAMYTRNLIIRLLVVLVLTLLFVVVFDRKIEGIYEAQIIGSMVYIFLFLPYIFKNIAVKFETVILKKMLHYSFPLVLSSFFIVVLSIADRYILNFISGLESVGIYSLGNKIANVLKIFIVMSVQLALTPTVFRMVDKPGIKRFLSKMMTYFTFGLMFCVLVISLYGQEVIKLFTAAEPDYWDAYLVIPFIAFGIVFGMMKDTSTYGLQIVKKTGVMASVILFVSLLNVGLNILFIPFMGAIGAGLSMLLSQIIYFFVMLFFAHRYYPVPYELRKVFLAIALGAVFCVAAYFIRDFSLISRLTIKTLLLFTYPVILYFLGFYDKEELQAIQGFWKKWRHPGAWKENISALKF